MALPVDVQAKAADIENYRGRYDGDRDRRRAERFARQQASGLFPAEAMLSASGPGEMLAVPAWDELTGEQRTRYARHMTRSTPAPWPRSTRAWDGWWRI